MQRADRHAKASRAEGLPRSSGFATTSRFSLGSDSQRSMIRKHPPHALNPDILWFVRLGIEQGLFTRTDCVRVRALLGGRPGMLEFAQKMVDDDIVNDLEALEELAGVSATKGRLGAPSRDPFVSPDDHVEDIVAMPVKKVEAGPPPKFAFDTIELLDDKALGRCLKELLGSSVRFGASDLHLCTGRRPFVRKDRAISFISGHTLNADEALRLNTALLTPQQSKMFNEKHMTSTSPWRSANSSAIG